MKRLLTAGIFGTILGIVGTGTTNASIVSSGFLDEKLTEYALSTSLDLKANQTDLTALSNKIGDAWPYGSDISGGLYNLYWQLYPQEITLENASDLVRFLFGGKIESGINQGGVLNILGQSVVDTGAYDINTGQIDEGFRSLIQLTNGWTSTDGTTYLGVKDLNTKIGDLPKDIMLYNVKTDRVEPVNVKELGVHSYFDIINYLLAGNGLEYNSSVIAPLAVLSQYTFRTNVLDTKIGTLPSGSLLGLSQDSDQIYKVADGTDTPVYPANVAEMIQQLYGAPQAGHRGIIPVIGRNISDLSKSITTRIGTLPDGKTVTDMISETDAKIGTIPTEYATVGAALTAIKGIAEDAKAAALAAIPDPKQEGSSGKFVLTVDIVGDNATYHWEKIDREGETTTTE